jgi:DNA-binding response OmpR family regulator
VARPILVVDDEADLAATYERLLRRRGYRAIAVGTRREGLLAVQAAPFALVVADLRLPDGDGLDVVRAARQAPTPAPVIVVTAFLSQANHRAALAAGASACLAKPFDTATFLALVERTLRGGSNGGSG